MDGHRTNSRPLYVVLVLLAPAACYVGVESVPAIDATSGATDAVSTGDAPNDGQTHHEFGELAFPGLRGTPAVILMEGPSGPVEVDHTLYENGYGVEDGDIVLYGPGTSMSIAPGAGRSSPRSTSAAAGATPGLTNSTDPQEGGIARLERLRWPGGIIPYEMSEDFPKAQAFLDAVAHWEAHTPIQLVPRTADDDDYVELVDTEGCSSQLGRVGGRQELSLGTNCWFGQAVHEIGHAVGLHHEQKRSDRDDHVIVDQANIDPDHWDQFYPYGFRGIDVGDYDLESIMHYGSCYFSVCSNAEGGTCMHDTASNCGPRGDQPCACTVYDQADPGCAHCTCWDGDECLNPSITLLDHSQFSIQRTGLSEGDIDAVEIMYGICPEGNGQLVCGGVVGLDSQVLYQCDGGRYTEVQTCTGGCATQPAGSDTCSDANTCPNGDALYCGSAVGLDADTLYSCMGGEYSVDEVCDLGCVETPIGLDDQCLAQPTQCDAGSGPCCPAGLSLPPGTVCGNNVESQYGCPWGIDPGDNVGIRYRDRYCSGTSPACDGPLGPWSAWQIEDDCASDEVCAEEDPMCNPAGPDDCVSGSCCDGGSFRPSDFICQVNADGQYDCPWGTNPGDDVGIRYRDRYCSGSSASCNGSLGAWGPWQTQDACGMTEDCSPGDPTCNSTCPAANYWSPSSMANLAWDVAGVQQLRLEHEEISGDWVRVRICKQGGGTFLNDIHFYYEEWVKYSGWQVYDGSLISAGNTCSNWIDVDTSTWNEGEGLGGDTRVVSPSGCAPMWGDWCNGPDPGCGNCWYLPSGVMTRTCL